MESGKQEIVSVTTMVVFQRKRVASSNVIGYMHLGKMEGAPNRSSNSFLDEKILGYSVELATRQAHRWESNLAISSSPVPKIMYSYYWAYCYRMKRKEIFSSAPGLSVMTLRECGVDRPFPVT